MNIIKVTYQKAFVIGPYLQEKVGFEAEIDNAEDEKKALTKLKEIAEQWHNENNPDPAQIAPTTELPVITKLSDRQIGITPEDILSSPDLVVLGTYQWIIKGKPELERAYMLRYDELSKQTQ